MSDRSQAHIADNVQRVRDAIADAATRSGRDPADVRFMAVTKTRTAAEVDAVIRAGIPLVGENKVQEAEEKKPHVTESAEWHMIGHLQSNKVANALATFSMIQSVDSVKLAERIARLTERERPFAVDADGRVPVLIEVNTSGEESKYGFTPDEAVDAFGAIRELSSLSVRGFMTIGKFVDDEVEVRACFAALREIRERAVSQSGDELPVLSMGMTSDYAWAVEEGSTLVRVGTAIFGPRG
jgi:pyridoxal phosphate enzyme (YggS family)